MRTLAEDLQKFLDSSPTSWHAAEQIMVRLALKNFEPLDPQQSWDLLKGKGYFVNIGGTVIAFVLPKKPVSKISLVATHTDSPALKLKPHPESTKDNMHLLLTEVYGAPLLHSWLSRDLAIAGRIVLKNAEGALEEHLIFLDETPVTIPQLAIHLDRGVNEKGLVLNPQQHLCALASLCEPGQLPPLTALLHKKFPHSKLLSHDLMLVPLEPSRTLGFSSEYLASYRLDNLVSAHASLSALASSPASEDTLYVSVFFDHEEIGSGSQEGAASSALNEMLQRISGLSLEDFSRTKYRSRCLSVDMTHALHPNYPEKSDPNHPVHLGGGVVLKFNAAHKYATSAKGAAFVIDLCQKLSIPYQSFVSRSDMPCGTTVGPMIAQTLGIETTDIGIAQLSMHAARELIACRDYAYLFELLKGFYG